MFPDSHTPNHCKNMKNLSSIANDVLRKCALILNTSVGSLIEEFETTWKPETSGYARKLVEFCSSKALAEECKYIAEKINDGSFTRFTFDIMLAWEIPSSQEEESHSEVIGKEKEDKKLSATLPPEIDEVSLFYSDMMPLLANEGPSVGEDAFVWLGSLVPLVADVVNGRFTFETLTAPTGNRLFLPAYDMFLKEIDKCVKHLAKQAKPKGVELADDEFILHVEGTVGSQRVVRHIGGTSWPGRLTLTNYALYFEASGVITYDDAVKIDLSKNVEHTVKSGATGPWGAPLFDKAIIYESPEQSERIVLEFPEMTSSTRRDHWLALVKEVIFMHQFLSKYKLESPLEVWEMNARTILGIIRLHAAREMLRISPPIPTKFLIFSLFDELPKGDLVLGELAENLKIFNCGRACSASSILRSLNMVESFVCCSEVKEVKKECTTLSHQENIRPSLENAINQSREESKQADIAKATTEDLKERGIAENATILIELLKPLLVTVPLFQKVISWERPALTVAVTSVVLLVIYKEWIGLAIAGGLLWFIHRMLKASRERVQDKYNEIVICTGADQRSTVDSIVSAQFGLRTVYEITQTANITILKLWSIMCFKSRKHANMTMAALFAAAVILAVIPLKFIIISAISYYILMTSKLGKYMTNEQGNRRLREWWDSIPIIPVRIINKTSECPG